MARAILRAGDRAKLDALVSTLANDFVAMPMPNHRKGGLIGLAAVTVALAGTADSKLDDIVPPVLKCFADADQRVRYYACEALYNIAKAARVAFVRHFPDAFDALCKLSADNDPNVQNAAHLLDRLVKDIVTESVEAFDVAKFASMLRERIGVLNPYVRQFLVGWITALDSVPEIDMLTHLPDILDGLLNMLSDPNREIRQQADGALGDFLAEIRGEGVRAHRGADLGALAGILVGRCGGSGDEFTRVTCINWLREFVSLAGDSPRLVPHFASIIGAVLPCMSRTEAKVRETAARASEELLASTTAAAKACARGIGEIESAGGLDLPGILAALKKHAGDGAKGPTRLEALRWYAALCDGSPETVRRLSLDASGVGALDELLASLGHDSDEVVTRAMRVLGSLGAGEETDFDVVVRRVVTVFASDGGDLLERRGSTVVRTLCAELGAEQRLQDRVHRARGARERGRRKETRGGDGGHEPDTSHRRVRRMRASLSGLTLWLRRLRGHGSRERDRRETVPRAAPVLVQRCPHGALSAVPRVRARGSRRRSMGDGILDAERGADRPARAPHRVARLRQPPTAPVGAQRAPGPDAGTVRAAHAAAAERRLQDASREAGRRAHAGAFAAGRERRRGRRDRYQVG